MDTKPYLEPRESTDKVDIYHVEDGQLSDSSAEYDAIEETEPGKRVWWICMTASVGGFLFGISSQPFICFDTYSVRLRYWRHIRRPGFSRYCTWWQGFDFRRTRADHIDHIWRCFHWCPCCWFDWRQDGSKVCHLPWLCCLRARSHYPSGCIQSCSNDYRQTYRRIRSWQCRNDHSPLHRRACSCEIPWKTDRL